MALELYSRRQREIDEPNLGQVGDVKQSILTEAQFQSIHGSAWTLMDGKSVVGSQYETVTGNSTLPDARGQFLRGKNNGRSDGQENPDGDLTEGTFQVDEMQGHKHNLDQGGGGGAVGGWFVTNNNNLSDTATMGPMISDGVNGTPRNGLETRPKNITVNYFVKID